MSEKQKERLHLIATAIVLFLLLAATALAQTQGEPGSGAARLATLSSGGAR